MFTSRINLILKLMMFLSLLFQSSYATSSIHIANDNNLMSCSHIVMQSSSIDYSISFDDSCFNCSACHCDINFLDFVNNSYSHTIGIFLSNTSKTYTFLVLNNQYKPPIS